MELQQRKKSLKKLFIRIRDWQFEKVREEPDKALTEDYRVLEEEDLLRYQDDSYIDGLIIHVHTVGGDCGRGEAVGSTVHLL